MSNSHVSAFDRTLQKTHRWLGEIALEMQWQEQEQAYAALRAVLHALRDRLLPEEAVHLSAQLPMLIRGFYFEGWHPSGKPLKYRHKADFLDRVQREAPGIDAYELERVVTTVFQRLSAEMPSGELEQVRNQLPEEIRALWPQAA